ncbi:MAG: DUF4383 domain-containing protein [Actinomycetota bacterium]
MLFGIIYIAVGAIGFAVTSGVGFAATSGKDLIIFEVNPLHNIVHLAVGLALVLAARAGAQAAKGMNAVVGGVYLIVGVLGFALVGTDANLIALNQPDNLLHLASAAVLLFLGTQTGASSPVSVRD